MQSQSVLLACTHICKPYTDEIIEKLKILGLYFLAAQSNATYMYMLDINPPVLTHKVKIPAFTFFLYVSWFVSVLNFALGKVQACKLAIT